VVFSGIVVDVVDIHRQPVGDDEFLEESHHHDEQAASHPFVIKVVLDEELGQEAGGTLDGACHQLREKGHVQGEIPEVPFRLLFAAVDVDGIAQCLEGVEGDAHRQQHFERRQGNPVEVKEELEIRREEVEIFESEKHAEIADQAHQQKECSAAGGLAAADAEGGRVIEHRGSEQEYQVVGLPASVEVVARSEQKYPPEAEGQGKIPHHDNGEEYNEVERIKEHRGSRLHKSLMTCRETIGERIRPCQRIGDKPDRQIRKSSRKGPYRLHKDKNDLTRRHREHEDGVLRNRMRQEASLWIGRWRFIGRRVPGCWKQRTKRCLDALWRPGVCARHG